MSSFETTGLSTPLLKSIKHLGFENPTPIQAKTIPHLLSSDQDVIAFAQTGTGKTAAFGLPSLQLTNSDNRTTQTLILCPTRELCVQITNDITNYAKYIEGMNIVAVYGGASIESQMRELKKGAHIVVGTPGRTHDLIRRKKLRVGSIQRLVLDEADEMLTMGFKDELDAILDSTPAEKQTLLFSATMSQEIARITKSYMNNPVKISATRQNTGAENVNHTYYMVHAKDKYRVLKRIADIHPNIYGIIFCRTRRETKEIANKLMHDGYNADALHGDLSQAQRDEAMEKFRKGHLQLLVATDVAARGLDVNNLSHIINFNIPDNPEVYIHRSGRTGRAGKSGTSIAIIHTREIRKIKDLERKFKLVFSREMVPSGREICTKQLFALIDKVEKVEVDEEQIAPFLPLIFEKLEWLEREELIKHFVSAEFNRFLDYYKNSKDINITDRKEKKKQRQGKFQKDNIQKSDIAFKNLYINVGTKQDIDPIGLIALINRGLKSGNVEIGRIEIMKKFSFFEIDANYCDQLISSLTGKVINGTKLLVEQATEKPKGAKTSSTKELTRKNDRKPRGRKRNPFNNRKGKRRR